MKYILLLTILMTGVVSFNSYAATCPTNIKMSAGTYSPYYGKPGAAFINIYGCEYAPVGFSLVVDNGPHKGNISSPDGFISTGNQVFNKTFSLPVVNTDNPDSTEDTPPVPDITFTDLHPDYKKTYSDKSSSDTTNLSQLGDLFTSCVLDLQHLPYANSSNYNPFIDHAYNKQVRQCNTIHSKISSLVETDKMAGASDDNHSFFTRTTRGDIVMCYRNPLSREQWYSVKDTSYPGELLGMDLSRAKERKILRACDIDEEGKNNCDRDVFLVFNYTRGGGSYSAEAACNEVYIASSPGDDTYNDNGSLTSSDGGAVLSPGDDTAPPSGISLCSGDDCRAGTPFNYERMGNVIKDRLSESYDVSATRSQAQKDADSSFSGVTGALDKLINGASGLVNGGVVGEDFTGASGQMAQIGSGSGSPLLDRFKLQGLPSSSQCRPVVFGAGQPHEFSFDCDKINLFKQIFGFLLYFWTFITLYNTFTSLPSKNKE